jgi:hypothetical protein
MRLIGSLTEDAVRRGLTASHAALLAGAHPPLREVLISNGVDLATAFVLHWIPEQAEDIFTVLDGTRRVLTVDLPRDEVSGSIVVNAVPFDDFRRAVARGSRSKRVQFAVAVALLREASGGGG